MPPITMVRMARVGPEGGLDLRHTVESRMLNSGKIVKCVFGAPWEQLGRCSRFGSGTPVAEVWSPERTDKVPLP